ncbi:MAG: class I SAM-dependent methyltransferase [Bdellovibrionales bacterium]|nr:class I SAM-dependent methyltransferase [Bdellovibrionales bacterium]
MSANHENKMGYDTWSSFYDDYVNPTVAADDLSFPSQYSEVREKKVLEIGCGTGRHTVRLLAAKNQVTGIDISSGMLKVLNQKISSPDLTLIEGDFMTHPLEPRSYDHIVASLVLEHIEDLSAFFSKCGRILKKGGKVFLSELHPERMAQGIFAHFKDQKGSEVHLKSVNHTETEFRNSATQSGFEILKCKTVLGDPALVKINESWEKHLGKPMIQIWVLELSQ